MNSGFPLAGGQAISGMRRAGASRKLLVLLGAGILSVALGYTGYSRFLAAAPAAPALQTSPARMGSLVSTVSTTGSVVATRQAKLSFTSSGKLAELGVAVGDRVKSGQQLAKLDQQTLQTKLAQSESSLRVARIKLQQLKDGATPEEIAAAEASYKASAAKYRDTTAGPKDSEREAARLAVNQATLALASTQAGLDQLKNGPTAVDLAAAEASVGQARASLTSAQVKLDTLKAGPTAADWASALAGVESARANLQSAQNKVDQIKAGYGQATLDLQNQEYTVQTASTSLLKAQDQLQAWRNGDHAGGTSNSQMMEAVNNAQSYYDLQVAKLAQMRASAPTELTSALASLSSAQASYNAAVAKVDLMKAGPLPADLVPAQGAVETAKLTLASAQAKLDQLKNPTDRDIGDAQAKVDQAQATLVAAQAKLADLEAGPTDVDVSAAESSLASAKAALAAKVNPPKVTDLAMQEETVNQAVLSVKQAQTDLQGSVITAPFDGVVSVVNGNVGEQVSGAVVTLVDPSAIRIDVTVDETDVAKLLPGQAATVGFDSLPDLKLQGKVTGVAPAGTTTQGVVSYLVSVGVNAPPRLLPAGMSSSVSIETERKDNVLLVPNRAVRTQGRNKVVDVLVGEKTAARTVQVGSSNEQFTQIISGLQEGEIVVIPSTTVRSTMNPGGAGGPMAPQPQMKVITK
ncbi:MAG TPA: efflux RND transporter periplasmic adaptor subunit [Chloroflexota bacterium]